MNNQFLEDMWYMDKYKLNQGRWGMTDTEREVFEFVKGFVDRVEDHHIDETSCLSAVADILDKCEDLALEIEDGKHERFDDRKKGEDY